MIAEREGIVSLAQAELLEWLKHPGGSAAPFSIPEGLRKTTQMTPL